MTEPLLRMTGDQQALSRRAGARRRRSRGRARRDPRPARRERRRQVDAAQDPVRRATARTPATISFDGEPVRFATPHDAQRARHRHDLPGVHARPEHDDRRERLHRPRAGVRASSSTGARWRPRPARSRSASGSTLNPMTLVRDLSVAEQQMVEIARALSMQLAPHRHGRADLGAELDRGRQACSASSAT